MADNAHKVVGEYRDVTVTSVSYTATSSAQALTAIATGGARRIIFNNSANPLWLNRVTSTTGTTTCYRIAAAGKDEDTTYFGVVYIMTSAAVSADVRVEEIKYNAY